MAGGNAIARGSVILTANADKMTTGLNQAGQQVEGWGKGLSGKLGSLFKGGIVAGAGLALGETLMEIPGRVIGKFQEMKESIDHASKAARAFGTDMGTWQGIVHAADLSGVKVEELESALGKFRRQVDGPIDQALFDFAKRLEGVQDPGERARILVENFGKSGMKLAGLFESGEAGLRGLVEEAHQLGFALSEADGKAIEEANDAVRRTEKAVDGLWNKIVIALAPAFVTVANAATQALKGLQPVFDWMGRALSGVIEVGTFLFESLGRVIQVVAGMIGQLGERLFDLTGPMPQIQDANIAAFRAIGTAGAYAWDVIKAGIGAVSIAIGFVIEKGLTPVITAFGKLVGLAKHLPEALRPSWLNGFIKGVDDARNSVAGMGRGMQDWGKKQIDDFGKSGQTFNEMLDQFLARKKKIEEPLRPGGGLDAMVFEPRKFAAAIEKGSKESYSIEMRNKFSDLVPQKDKVEDELRKGNRQRDQGNRKLADIDKRLMDLEVLN